MNQRRPLGLFVVPVLAFSASCLLDTTPLANHEPQAASSEKRDAQSTEMPVEVTTDSGVREDAAIDAGIVTPPPPPSTTATTPLDASVAPPTPAKPSSKPDADTAHQCDGLGSYGLRAVIDTAWDATEWFDAGRGAVELYGLIRVDAIDPDTNKASGSFLACGLSLPPLNSRALCSRYQLQLPESIWDEGKLHEQALDGTYDCDAAHCSLRFAPASYSLGIQLADAHAPWPKLKDISPAQLSDDDGDGSPGVGVDVVSVASFASGQTGCTPSGPTDSSNSGPGNSGPGNSGRGNSGPGNSGRGSPGNQAPMMPATTPVSIGRLPLALRAQLTAALQLAPDCTLQERTASDATLELRAAGCLGAEGTDPASANMSCSEQLQAGYDRALPQFLTPKKEADTTLQVVRVATGTQLSCEQVRRSMF